MVRSIAVTILNSLSLVFRLVSKNIAIKYFLICVLPQLGRIKPDAAFA